MSYLYQDPESLIPLLILLVALCVFAIMLIAFFASLFRDRIPDYKPILRSLMAKIVASSAEYAKHKESNPGVEAAIPATSSTPEKPESMLTFGPKAGRTIVGILLTTLLMVGLFLAPVFAYALIADPLGSGSEFFGVGFWVIILASLGIAAGGAAGVRIAHLSWRQTVLATLLAGAIALPVSRLELFSLFYRYLGFWGKVYDFGIALIIFSATVFFLPLFDPAMRRTGVAPSVSKAAWTAGFWIAPCFLAIAATGGPSTFFGLELSAALVYWITIGWSLGLVGVGLILALVKRTEMVGTSFGGVGVFLGSFLLLTLLLFQQ